MFLADRWFNSSNLLRHINDLGHTYCIRLKKVIMREHMIKNNMNTFIRMFLLIVRDNKLNN